MSGSYRVELAASKRSGCSSVQCKKEGVKIDKGELRLGVTVMFNEHTSMKWRHWGCVTPLILSNWNETSGGDMDLIDGYDELPDGAKEKVKRSLEQGHVDDDEWNGDLELNRLDNNPKGGLFFTAAQKKARAKAEGLDGDEAPKKKTTKKRKQADDDDDDGPEEKPAPKKRGRKAKAEQDDADEEPTKATTKKAPAKKAKPVKAAEPSDVEEPQDDEAADDELNEPALKPAAKAKKAKGKAAKSSDAEAKPQRKGRARKAVAEDEE